MSFTLRDLSKFYGSDRLYFERLFNKINYTEGIKFIRNNGCNWLIIDILSNITQFFMNKDFVLIKVEKDKKQIIFEDGNSKVLKVLNYEIFDCGCTFTLYFENMTLFLPMER